VTVQTTVGEMKKKVVTVVTVRRGLFLANMPALHTFVSNAVFSILLTIFVPLY
jgi:hypothetical protein